MRHSQTLQLFEQWLLDSCRTSWRQSEAHSTHSSFFLIVIVLRVPCSERQLWGVFLGGLIWSLLLFTLPITSEAFHSLY